MKTLGQLIRELREEKDLSLREFSKKLNLSAPFVSDIELGRRFPSDDILEKMAEILDVPSDELRAPVPNDQQLFLTFIGSRDQVSIVR